MEGAGGFRPVSLLTLIKVMSLLLTLVLVYVQSPVAAVPSHSTLIACAYMTLAV
jgi:hypothetical protein